MASYEYPIATGNEYPAPRSNHNTISDPVTPHVSFKPSRPLSGHRAPSAAGLIRTAGSQYEYRRYTNHTYPDPYDNYPATHNNTSISQRNNPYNNGTLLYKTPSFHQHQTIIAPNALEHTSHLLYDQYTNHYQQNITTAAAANQPGNYFRGLATANTAVAYVTRPIKMQREEVIVEHSQLMALADGHHEGARNNGSAVGEVAGAAGGGVMMGDRIGVGGGGPRPHHYTQVRIKWI